MHPFIELYTRRNCHLCEVAKNKLFALKREINFDILEIDIDSGIELQEKYGELVPVIMINGEIICKFDVNIEELKKRLQNTN